MLLKPGPLLLSDITGTLALGATFQPQTEAFLRNSTRQAILIDEVRFDLRTTDTAARTARLGGSVRVKLTLGRHQLTHGHVPIWTACRALSPWEFATATVGGNAQVFSRHTWRFPKPLYVPPGQFLTPSFYYPGFDPAVTNPTGVTVRASYACRVLPSDAPVPRRVALPWCASWAGIIRTPTADVTDQSTASDLVNPHDEPLYVERFVGRIADGLRDLAPAVANNGAGASASVSTAGELDIPLRFTMVKMIDHKGRVVVNTNTPFNFLFKTEDRSWRVNTVLDPKGFYLASLDENYASYNQSGSRIQPMIGMIGHRLVDSSAVLS